MSIEEAMIFLLSTEGRGMTVEDLAVQINFRKLYVRKDGMPVNERQVWAAFFRHPEVFCREGRLIRLAY